MTKLDLLNQEFINDTIESLNRVKNHIIFTTDENEADCSIAILQQLATFELALGDLKENLPLIQFTPEMQ